MKFITSPYIPRKESEVIAKVGEMLEGDFFHENYLGIMKDRLPLSNLDGPTLSWLIQQRKKPIRVEMSFLFFTAPARYREDEIIINANLLGRLDEDELTYILGSCIAGIVIDDSPYWYHPGTNPFKRGFSCIRSLAGSLLSDAYRIATTKMMKGVYEYGTELRTVEEGSRHVVD